MTTSTALHTTASSGTASSLRAVLLVDGYGTAAVGVVALALAVPLADHVGTPGALRAVGMFFVVAGLGMVLARRLAGHRLAAVATVYGALDLVWAALCIAALAALDTTALGTALVLAVVATCLGMGAAKLALARRLQG